MKILGVQHYGIAMPKNFQPFEQSGGHGTDGDARVWLDPDSNPNVLVVNRDDVNRKLNLNWFDNRWNRNYWFVGVRPRNFLHFFSAHLGGEVCLISWFFHPPSILPTS